MPAPPPHSTPAHPDTPILLLFFLSQTQTSAHTHTYVRARTRTHMHKIKQTSNPPPISETPLPSHTSFEGFKNVSRKREIVWKLRISHSSYKVLVSVYYNNYMTIKSYDWKKLLCVATVSITCLTWRKLHAPNPNFSSVGLLSTIGNGPTTSPSVVEDPLVTQQSCQLEPRVWGWNCHLSPVTYKPGVCTTRWILPTIIILAAFAPFWPFTKDTSK